MGRHPESKARADAAHLPLPFRSTVQLNSGVLGSILYL